MRLFVALSISAEVRANLATLIGELRRADSMPRWVHPANLHVTLKFIGEVPAEKRPAIENALAGVPASSLLSLAFRGIGFFPNERRPAVVWVGIHASADLPALAARIDHALESCGVPREARPFSPHLTLARFKETRFSTSLRAAIEKSTDRAFGNQSVSEFHLIESKLKAIGAEYTTLRSFPFAA